MVDATISRVRLHDLACLGRSRLTHAGIAAAHEPSAPRRRSGTDANSIAASPSPRPRHASSRPGTGDSVASTI
jgi:hypothetical protein